MNGLPSTSARARNVAAAAIRTILQIDPSLTPADACAMLVRHAVLAHAGEARADRVVGQLYDLADEVTGLVPSAPEPGGSAP